MSDENQDNVIRNPDRERGEHATQHHVVPEHVRLGVTPIFQDFPSLDGEVIVEEDTNIDSHILDNNEYVNYGFNVKSKPQPPKSRVPAVGDYVLMVQGKVISYGTHDYILTQAKSILYGEHPSFVEKNVQMEEIVVLKRLSVKVGVFIDE
jgi:hypothetical protein